MTWKERRVISFLTTILLILIAALLVVLGMRYRENRATPETVAPGETAVAAPIQDGYVSLSYENGAATLSFSQAESGIWTWDGDPDFPLDDALVNEILSALIHWAPQQTLTDPEALESSGLDNPSASLCAVTATGQKTSLLFGKSTTDGTSRYVRLNGDETTAYLVDEALYQTLCVPIYDMCLLPQMPLLLEERILSILLCGPTQEDQISGTLTILTAQQTEDGKTVSWRASGANVSDDRSVRALMEALENLSLTKCIDYAPSEEAASICGFDNPCARLKILYATEGGAEKDLTLLVGNLLPDASGHYLRLNEDLPIYLLSPDLADPIVTLAEAGLE